MAKLSDLTPGDYFRLSHKTVFRLLDNLHSVSSLEYVYVAREILFGTDEDKEVTPCTKDGTPLTPPDGCVIIDGESYARATLDGLQYRLGVNGFWWSDTGVRIAVLSTLARLNVLLLRAIQENS